ncbi:MAG: RNA methyltransferase [Deltaproteobacteria bacterium]|nr:RNA methyltransferase [Deltaproteobacteria bacterium]
MRIIDILSPNSRVYKRLLRLKTARGIKKYGMALVAGPRQVHEVARDFPDRCEAWIFSEKQRSPVTAPVDPIPGYRLADELFRQIDLFDTGRPLLVVRFSPFALLMEEVWPPGCTLCIPFQDPANVGAAIRAAAAFGVSRVVILKEAAHPFHPKAIRAAGGNVFRVPMVEGPRLSELAPRGVPVITLSPKGEDVSAYCFPPRFCLVPGLEGPGIPGGLSSAQALAIPMKNRVESLNAAMATGIVLYLWQRGRAD